MARILDKGTRAQCVIITILVLLTASSLYMLDELVGMNELETRAEREYVENSKPPPKHSKDATDYEGATFISHDGGVKANNKVAQLKQTDIIYKVGRWGDPLVIPDYKLIFFTLPKVASTEWKLLFRKMMSLPAWIEDISIRKLHIPAYNQLLYINNFTMDEVQEMLTSEEWTRAVIVREPKERVLSAFLNKFVNEEKFFITKCCQGHFFETRREKRKCHNKKKKGDLTYFLNRTLDCLNQHWTPQTDAIDNKWWNQMNFVGYMNTVTEDAKSLLKNIVHTNNGTTAWEDYGSTGWGSQSKAAFMVQDTSHHVTNAHVKLKTYYTPCLEMFVEKHWAKEWDQSVFHFDKFRIFNEHEYPDYKDCEIQ